MVFRYPTLDYGGPAGVAQRLSAVSGWKASEDLSFLNDWSYKLGAELLTPFGRGQLCESLLCSCHFCRSDGTDNLGVSARMKYGFLLDKMGSRLPVFRTESQEYVEL